MLRKVLRGTVVIAASVCAIGLGSSLGATPGHATTADWFAPASPQLSRVRQLPSNIQLPDKKEFCNWIVYFPRDVFTPETDCVGKTSLGYLSALGNGLMVDDKTFVPMMPSAGRATYSPVLNTSKIMTTYYSTGAWGEYLGFYNNLQRADLQDQRNSCGFSCTQRLLRVSKQPDFYVTGTDGKSLLVNIADVTQSINGNWLVVDSPSGLLRVDLASEAHTVLPFAQSLAQLPYANQSFIQMAVSDDGKLVVVAQTVRSSNVPPKLWLYDLSACTGKAVGHTQQVAEGCRVRDLWNGLHAMDPRSSDTGLSKVFSNPASLVNPQIVGSDNVSFDVTYNKSGNSFDAASYALTAPGGNLHNLGLLGLGDSYISGEGEFAYMKDTDSADNKCHQSALSYPFLLGSKTFSMYDSVACSGAKTIDITNESDAYEGQVKDGIRQGNRDTKAIIASMQPGYVSQNQFVGFYQPEAIILSVGGNDIGFGDIVGSCVGVGTCYPAYEDRLELMQAIGRSFNTLITTYQSITRASPASRIYVVGYPQIAAAGGSCGLNVHLDADEVQFSIDAINYLNSVIRQAAANAGVYYVDVSHALDGHRLCEPGDKAVNGLTEGNDQFPLIGHESYHPTVLGHKLLAGAISQATDNLTGPMPDAQPLLGPPAINDDNPLLVHAPLGKTGRPTRDVTHTSDASKSLWERGKDIAITVSGTFANFASNIPVAALLHSDPVYLGTFTTDANGDLHGTFTVPNDVPGGVHVLHLQGKDMGGNDVDIEQTVYIMDSPKDYDGDGIANTKDSCPYITNSGVDVDKDSVDDVCDPEITYPPANSGSGEKTNSGQESSTVTTAVQTDVAPLTLQVTTPAGNLSSTSAVNTPPTAANQRAGSVLGESANGDAAVAIPPINSRSLSAVGSRTVYVVSFVGLVAALLGIFFGWLLRRRVR